MHINNVRLNLSTFMIIVLLFIFAGGVPVRAGDGFPADIEEKLAELFDQADIPGLSVVMVKGEKSLLKTYGYANKKKETPVSESTLFQLGDCSKSFTALAVLTLVKAGKVSLDDPITRFFPNLSATYEGKTVPVTIEHLLHHTGGIPPDIRDPYHRDYINLSLEKTVTGLRDIRLTHQPGMRFRYASVNYDIIGAIIEKVSRLPFEDYVSGEVLKPLGMKQTTFNKPGRELPGSSGYKYGFFASHEYTAPQTPGSNPSTGIVTSAADILEWLNAQLHSRENPLSSLIMETQKPHRDVPPDKPDTYYYGMGWYVSLEYEGVIRHHGVKPNYSSYILLKPREKTAVAVLANSNSQFTQTIAVEILDLLSGQENRMTGSTVAPVDKYCSVIGVMLVLYLFASIAFIITIISGILKQKRNFEPFTLKKVLHFAYALILCLPFFIGVYLLPRAFAGLSWDSALIWGPSSMKLTLVILAASVIVSYFGYLLSLLFPQTNQYKRSIPLLVSLSLFAGIANAAVLFIITNSLFRDINLLYMLYYFCLAFLTYILGTKVVETRLINISLSVIYDLRMKLVAKLFSTSYQRFEKIDRGRVYATLNDDTNQIGASANHMITVVTCFITVVCAFIYLAVISPLATLVTLFVIILIAGLYYIVSGKSERFFEKTRDTRNAYMSQINGLLDGYKELSLHSAKKTEYEKDVEVTCREFRNKLGIARIKFVNAFLIGESLLLVTLGAVCFAFPRIFPGINDLILLNFIVVLMYLIGPINSILNSMPPLMELKVSWNRVNRFIKEIPSTPGYKSIPAAVNKNTAVDDIKIENLRFQYEGDDPTDRFEVGPINMDIKKGEILFIIGGNGSGKTTLAKILTGLYQAAEGSIKINGKPVAPKNIGEYFSVVFSDYHLFEKLYNVSLADKREESDSYLELLGLKQKVSLKDDRFSTIDLSGGQRKRLALFKCYLEDRPVYLFDEWAADQDPAFRKFFYRDLLLRMKNKGKIVIAITHDDHYFDVADRIIKLDMGKIEFIENRN